MITLYSIGFFLFYCFFKIIVKDYIITIDYVKHSDFFHKL